MPVVSNSEVFVAAVARGKPGFSRFFSSFDVDNGGHLVHLGGRGGDVGSKSELGVMASKLTGWIVVVPTSYER